MTALAGDGQAGDRGRQRRGGGRRSEPRLRLRPAARRRHRRVQPGLRQRRRSPATPAPATTCRCWSGRAKAIELLYLPRTIGPRRRSSSAWPPASSRPAELDRRGARARGPAGRRTDGRARRDAALGGLLRGSLLRGVAGVRVLDDDADRRHGRPPRRGRGVRGEAAPGRSRAAEGARLLSGWRPRSTAPGAGPRPASGGSSGARRTRR